MKLSIIIPVYRTAHTLDRCVESVLAQQYTDMEIILVDDGSPDNCPKKCDEWAITDTRITVIHQSNCGLSGARNAGIKKATGDYLTFVDSDDFIAPDTYQPLMELLSRRTDIDILEYPYIWHSGSSDERAVLFQNTEYSDIISYWLKGYAYEHTYAWNKIFKKELFANVCFPIGKVFEDVATLPLLAQQAKCIVTTDIGRYHYWLNPNGITNKAKGTELSMLLDAHMAMAIYPEILNDSRFYMNALNIQMDVFEFTGHSPILPNRIINPFATGLSFKNRLKAVALDLIGIKNICKLNTLFHKIQHSRS